ncbi:2-hydroxychromene-2-carboxylate isomerase [Flavobacterium enshiense DK69]|uniref:DSBA oxidoreductase n=1 Tax=Flavobacterium enshiense DK69 TaxID=1107311 RepID=V6S9I3_9FLAO|nr:DsbA family oxidoreductase [Flavobacterium enshiense]ESU23099.1 2-hydroxychromene-2-carboxylate isomerase [Flavobacterium enshiense DK69]KGO96037.1 DSBA oxidoreductase [Flavobacterium enshiense DK69]
MNNQLKIQIWSDVMCPFCYIGKRKLEESLQQFENKDAVTIEWKSFQLDPRAKYQPEDNTFDYLAKKYGRDRNWSVAMHESVTQQAKAVGLDYHFEKLILANSLNAHRLSHLAKKYHMGNTFEESLFKAHFTEGLDIGNKSTLTQLALGVGLKLEEIESVLNSDAYINEVEQEMNEAQSLGANGVPFFVFDDKYAVSGAQSPEVFLKTLQKTWEEGSFDVTLDFQNSTEKNSCQIDGCE